MRKIKRYSYSGLSLWKVNKPKFYCKYLSDFKLESTPATIPMRVGTICDVIMKHDMEKDLGLPTEDPMTTPEDWELVKDVYTWFKESGVYDSLVAKFQRVLDGGGEVILEGKIFRTLSDEEHNEFSIIGYADFMFRTGKNAPWSVLDLKTTSLNSKGKDSPRSPYNEVVYRDGRKKKYAKFEPYVGETDDWIGLGINSVPKMHAGQVTLYSSLLNGGMPEITWDGKHRTGIVQVTPTYVATSYGIANDLGILRDFATLNSCLLAGKPFGMDMSDEETKDEMEKWDDPSFRSCCLPQNFF